jgi:hypothetical protein
MHHAQPAARWLLTGCNTCQVRHSTSSPRADHRTQRGLPFQPHAESPRAWIAYLSSLNLTAVAHPLMEALTDQLRESTALVALDGVDIVYLNRVRRHRISSLPTLR